MTPDDSDFLHDIAYASAYLSEGAHRMARDAFEAGFVWAWAIRGMFDAIAEREREKAVEARVRWGTATYHSFNPPSARQFK